MTNNQIIFPAIGSDQLSQELQLQQSLLWEFYKTWVGNQAGLDSIAQGPKMFELYQQLSMLLNASLNSNTTYTFNEEPLLKFSEKSFKAVINFIADVIAPEKIFCLNHFSTADGTDHADLVLVIPENSFKTFDEIEKTVEFACLKHHRLSCTLFKASVFYKMIEEGHIYFSLACSAETLIYDDGSKIALKLRLDNRAEKIEKAKKEFYAGFEKAKTFYATAENHRDSNLTMAVFMLHQAAELCLRALSRSLTNQEKTTHNLKALLKFSLRITSRLSMIMDNGNKEDEHLLNILEGAYLGYRYSEKYNIEPKDLNTLFERIKMLHVHAEETFITWMNRYEVLINTCIS